MTGNSIFMSANFMIMSCSYTEVQFICGLVAEHTGKKKLKIICGDLIRKCLDSISNIQSEPKPFRRSDCTHWASCCTYSWHAHFHHYRSMAEISTIPRSLIAELSNRWHTCPYLRNHRIGMDKPRHRNGKFLQFQG
jgi:hypothetical protein